MEGKTKAFIIGIGAGILVGGALIMLNRKPKDSGKSGVLGVRGRGVRGRVGKGAGSGSKENDGSGWGTPPKSKCYCDGKYVGNFSNCRQACGLE